MNKKKIKREIKNFQETSVLDEYKNLEFSVVLIQPEHAGNIGSIARIMRNFDFENLLIFNPIEKKEMISSYETHGFAMHGSDILRSAEIIILDKQTDYEESLKEFLKKFDLIIATTAKGKHYSNIKRMSLFPENLTLPISKKKLHIAILFGKESRGLTNKELESADILIRIPTGETYPTLNLSHACGIILYEIFKKTHSIKLGRGMKPVLLADRRDRTLLYDTLQNIIKILKIRTHKKERVFLSFKNIFERSLITKKELSLIFGVFSKIGTLLSEMKPYE